MKFVLGNRNIPKLLRLYNGDFVSSLNDKINIFNSNNGRFKSTINISYTIHSLVILKNDYLLVSGSNKAEIWDAYTGKRVHSFDGLSNEIYSLLVLNDKLAIDDGKVVHIKEIGKLINKWLNRFPKFFMNNFLI